MLVPDNCKTAVIHTQDWYSQLLNESYHELAEHYTTGNYHVSVEGMLYSVPYIYIHKTVDIRLTDFSVEIYLNQSRIASLSRLHERQGQYATNPAHMPEQHQKYRAWDGDRFRKWAATAGPNVCHVIHVILSSCRVE